MHEIVAEVDPKAEEAEKEKLNQEEIEAVRPQSMSSIKLLCKFEKISAIIFIHIISIKNIVLRKLKRSTHDICQVTSDLVKKRLQKYYERVSRYINACARKSGTDWANTCFTYTKKLLELKFNKTYY